MYCIKLMTDSVKTKLLSASVGLSELFRIKINRTIPFLNTLQNIRLYPSLKYIDLFNLKAFAFEHFRRLG
jgi:hypothetical protein